MRTLFYVIPTKMDLSDQELIQAYLKTRHSQIFERLVSRYLKLVYTIAARIAHHHEDAQDISQDVFVKVWKYLHRYDGSKAFKPWLAQITKNTALDWMKKKRPLLFSGLAQDEEDFIDSLIDPQPLPTEMYEQKQEAEELDRVVERLPPHYAEVLRLRYHEGLTFQEIADRLEMIMDTVKTRHRRGLQSVKKLLNVEGQNEPK